MLKSMTERVTRAIEVLLPSTAADAGCPPDTYQQYKLIGGVCFVRVCSYRGDCSVYCGPWYSTNNNNC
ncbi:hypothetical protein [Actinomadura oligospora]|uniref:hypothetical protein n=1 Tax=Actinomadura oligospora TaxID=111804 RepID=UPI00047DFE65|nr:hypothetical protein [Actinomadura oligospora]